MAGVLALILRVLDPAAAETALRDHLATALATGDYRSAWAFAGRLADLCRGDWRLAEALDLASQAITCARQAGLGPWTQLGAEVRRLQVLAAMGQAGQVLAEVTRLRDHLATLPATPGPDDPADPWNVRETLLDTGRHAAILLGRWEEALDLSATVAASKRDRRAPAAAIARTRFSDYGPLLGLGRIGQALALLQDCLHAFQDAHDTLMIGGTLSALADAEDQRGHGDAAIRLQRDALRHFYLASDVAGIAVSYNNHGSYLARHARQPAPALTGHLAAALIRTLAGIGGDHPGSALDSARRAAADLRALGPAAVPPATVADLDRQLGDIPGTDLPALITRLAPDPQAAEQALRAIIKAAQELAADDAYWTDDDSAPADDSASAGD
jgi:hypothetical protein